MFELKITKPPMSSVTVKVPVYKSGLIAAVLDFGPAKNKRDLRKKVQNFIVEAFDEAVQNERFESVSASDVQDAVENIENIVPDFVDCGSHGR